MVYPSEAKSLQKTFDSWVKEYGIFIKINAESFSEIEGDPHYVWNEFEGEDGIHFVCTGDTVFNTNNIPFRGYFISRKPWDDSSPEVASAVEVECAKCEGEGETEDGESCENCEGEGSFFVTFPIAGGKWEKF